MRIEIKFAQLHSPLFIAGDGIGAGINLQMKLDPRHRQGLSLSYDREEEMLFVKYNESEAMVPLANVAHMEAAKVQLVKPEEPKKLKDPDPELARAKGKITAQVATPQSHVFAGEGHGDTGQEKWKSGKVTI